MTTRYTLSQIFSLAGNIAPPQLLKSDRTNFNFQSLRISLDFAESNNFCQSSLQQKNCSLFAEMTLVSH